MTSDLSLAQSSISKSVFSRAHLGELWHTKTLRRKKRRAHQLSLHPSSLHQRCQKCIQCKRYAHSSLTPFVVAYLSMVHWASPLRSASMLLRHASKRVWSMEFAHGTPSSLLLGCFARIIFNAMSVLSFEKPSIRRCYPYGNCWHWQLQPGS